MTEVSLELPSHPIPPLLQGRPPRGRARPGGEAPRGRGCSAQAAPWAHGETGFLTPKCNFPRLTNTTVPRDPKGSC